MPTDKMTVDERRKYLRTMKKRYGKTSRKEKKQLLDEMEIVTGQHRKSLIRLLNGSVASSMAQKWMMPCASSTRAWTISAPSD